LIDNPAEIGSKGSRKPRWEEVSVWRRRRWSAVLNIIGHFEILFNNVVMWKEVSRKVVKGFDSREWSGKRLGVAETSWYVAVGAAVRMGMEK